MRSNTFAVVISSMLMAAATQAQPAPTDPTTSAPAQTQTESTSTTTMPGTDSGTTSTTTPDASSPYDADQSNRSDAAAMAQQRWTQADTDRNGSLSRAEVQASMPTMASNFNPMDKNADGQLSQDEMHTFQMNTPKGTWRQNFKAADADRDGKLSLTEVQTGMPMLAVHFSTIDTDKDGKLSTGELSAHRNSMRQGSAPSMDADQGARIATSSQSTTTTTTGKRDDGTSNH